MLARSRSGRTLTMLWLAAFAWVALTAAAEGFTPEPGQTVVSLTFDDGTADHYDARPLLAQKGMRATFYVNSGSIGDTGRMTWAQLRALQATGNEIGGHTVDHARLVEMTPDEQRDAICDDREAIIGQGLLATNFAYPFGQPGGSEPIVEQCGYDSGRGTGNYGTSGNPNAELIPPQYRYYIFTVPAIQEHTSVDTIEGWVSQAESSGGGWIILNLHRICDGCDPYSYSITEQDLAELLDRLEQHEQDSGTTVKTVRGVLSSDVIAPDTTLDDAPEGLINYASPSFEFSANEAWTSFECRVDAAAFMPCTSVHGPEPLADGDHVFEVRAVDAAENTDATPAVSAFTIDTVAPDTGIDSGPAPRGSDSTPRFAFSGTEPGVSFECGSDAQDFEPCSSPFLSNPIPDGHRTFKVRATDEAGNVDPTPAVAEFMIDTAAPDTSISSGTQKPTGDATPAFDLSATEAGSRFECSVDGGSFFGCGSPYVTPRLPDGSHTVRARAIDDVNNVDPSPAVSSLTVDTTIPRMGLALYRGPRATSARYVRLSLRCPQHEPAGCAGTVSLRSVPRRKRAPILLGSASFATPGTGSITVRIPIRRCCRKLTIGRPRVRAIVAASDAAGNLGTVARIVRLGHSKRGTSASVRSGRANPRATVSAKPSRGLQTAIVNSHLYTGSTADTAFERTRAAGATAVRTYVSWRAVAPDSRPPNFDPTDPGSSRYDWNFVDEEVEKAVAYGIEPILGIDEAPLWAQGAGSGAPGTINPSPSELGGFALAAARRYSGSYAGLPRVRRWLIWNEPNLTLFLNPQKVNGQPISPRIYRGLLNAAAAAIHSVHADNTVVGGALAPLGNEDLDGPVRPMRFMRELLCVSGERRPRATCDDKTEFDAWAVHPYTFGGPATVPLSPDDISVATLPRVRALLRAAARLGHIESARSPRLWVTEFSWDSRPPDPGGVPGRLLARWVSEAMFRMYGAGVELVTWFKLRDDATRGRPFSQTFQSGLYSRCHSGISCDRPKPVLRSFRFPFVAYKSGGRRVYLWGRTPAGKAARVLIQQRVRGKWRRLERIRTNSHGIFSLRLRRLGSGSVRARLRNGEPAAASFSLAPDRYPPATPFG